LKHQNLKGVKLMTGDIRYLLGISAIIHS